MNKIEGTLAASGRRFGIVCARFNNFIGKSLLDGAIDCLLRHGADESKIDVVHVPGSFELPVAAHKLAHSQKYDAVICLGVLVRGSTPHFDYIAAEATKGVAQAAISSSVPVSYGVITADTLEQAIERAGTKSGNKGWEAAMASIEMADLFSRLNKHLGSK